MGKLRSGSEEDHGGPKVGGKGWMMPSVSGLQLGPGHGVSLQYCPPQRLTLSDFYFRKGMPKEEATGLYFPKKRQSFALFPQPGGIKNCSSGYVQTSPCFPSTELV